MLAVPVIETPTKKNEMTKQKKKLCFLMPVHPLVGKGGAEYQAGLVLNAIANRSDYDVHFLARRIPDYRPPDHTVWKIGSENVFSKYGTFVDVHRIYRTLTQISPDIIYQNVGCAYTGVAAAYARTGRAQLVWHIASDADVDFSLIPTAKERLACRVDRYFLDYGIKKAHKIIAQTRHQANLLEKNFCRKCDACIPVGHPYPQFIPPKSQQINILWIANIKPLKQPEVFVALARVLLSRFPDVQFVMMGQSKTSDARLQQLLKSIDSLPNLTYLGPIPQSKVNSRLSQGHILVNTSIYEGFSNTFVQAWMRRVPVISLNTDPDGVLVKERIGFHSRNFDQLCRDVQSLVLDTRLREDMGDRARKYAHRNHTSEKMLNDILSLIDST